ncbi:MAG: hypothetical protein ACQEP5_06560, partial [Actinomycetota bacterium]
MKKRKNIKVRHKRYLSKITIMLLILSLIFFISSCRQAAGVDEAEYPPPQGLHIEEFSGSGADRAANLAWEALDTEPNVIQYVVYKFDAGAVKGIGFENKEEIDRDLLDQNAEEVVRTADTNHMHIIGEKDYCFYVTAIYDGDIESSPSNVICAGVDIDADVSPVGPGTGEDGENGNGADLAEEGKDPDMQPLSRDAAGLCYNSYYPAAPGASYTYQVTGTRSWVQTHTITDVSGDDFTEEVVQDLVTHIYEWECLPEGLVNTFGGVMITENDTVYTTSD